VPEFNVMLLRCPEVSTLSRTSIRRLCNCPLVNDCDLMAGFCDSQSFTRGQLLTAYWSSFFHFYLPSPIWRLQWGGSLGAIGFIFGLGKLEWLGYNLVKVAWWSSQSLRHNTSTWQTDRLTDITCLIECTQFVIAFAVYCLQVPQPYLKFAVELWCVLWGLACICVQDGGTWQTERRSQTSAGQSV